jgi:hypothetical protein
LLHRKLGGFRAVEDFGHIFGEALEIRLDVDSIGYEPTISIEIGRDAMDADPRAAAYDAMVRRVSEMWRQKDPLP